ncbi:MAG: bacterioferritin-associated ferredoxin [Xanthomonadaceae bacterium]|nr:bacterioferritin-associated ferredoxin [Xanthomonadaceae bacterium]
MYVCICNGVTDKHIRTAAGEGCRSVAELTMRTGCGSNCGSCLEYAASMLAEAHAQREQSLPFAILSASAA